MLTHGIQHVRSHVDVTDPSLTALQALLELKHDLKEIVDLQLVAFPQDGILSFPHGKELMEQAVKEGADVVGGIPHFENTTEYGWESVHFLMDLADRYDKLVDVHCDEIDDPASRHLEVLATESSNVSSLTAWRLAIRRLWDRTMMPTLTNYLNSSNKAKLTLWPIRWLTSTWAVWYLPQAPRCYPD